MQFILLKFSFMSIKLKTNRLILGLEYFAHTIGFL